MTKDKNNSKINPNQNYKKLLLSQLQKKYSYLLLGITIIVLGYLSFKSLFPAKKQSIFQKLLTPAKTKQQVEEKKEKTYITKTGDHLWKIAEETYGSGYNAYDIAKANKITNPDIIHAGVKLNLPEVTPKSPTKGSIVTAQTQPVKMAESKYTVKSGDYLWKIALDAYGDGYAWVKIANANKIANPDLIYPGTVLNIPR